MRAEPALSPPDSSGFAVVGEWGAGGRYAGAMRLTAPARIREPLDLSFLGRAARTRDGLEVDLGAVEWVSPAGVAGLLAACLGASANALDATVLLPESRTVRTYLGHIGFLAELERNGWAGEGEPEPAADAAIGPHLPVMRLTTENEVVEASERLPAMLNEAGLGGDLSISLVDVLAEVAGNACEHGSACYVVAEVDTGRGDAPGIHLAVADFGKGFAETLRGKHGRMTDGAAIRHAFTERVSGTGLRERGFGLGQVADVVDVNPENVLWVFSRAGYAIRSRGQFRSGRESHQRFPGTLVAVWVPATPHAPQRAWR